MSNRGGDYRPHHDFQRDVIADLRALVERWQAEAQALGVEVNALKREQRKILGRCLETAAERDDWKRRWNDYRIGLEKDNDRLRAALISARAWIEPEASPQDEILAEIDRALEGK